MVKFAQVLVTYVKNLLRPANQGKTKVSLVSPMAAPALGHALTCKLWVLFDQARPKVIKDHLKKKILSLWPANKGKTKVLSVLPIATTALGHALTCKREVLCIFAARTSWIDRVAPPAVYSG